MRAEHLIQRVDQSIHIPLADHKYRFELDDMVVVAVGIEQYSLLGFRLLRHALVQGGHGFSVAASVTSYGPDYQERTLTLALTPAQLLMESFMALLLSGWPYGGYCSQPVSECECSYPKTGLKRWPVHSSSLPLSNFLKSYRSALPASLRGRGR